MIWNLILKEYELKSELPSKSDHWGSGMHRDQVYMLYMTESRIYMDGVVCELNRCENAVHKIKYIVHLCSKHYIELFLWVGETPLFGLK